MDDEKIEQAIYIAALLKKKHQKALTRQEASFLEKWIQLSEANRQLYYRLNDPQRLEKDLRALESYDVEEHIRRLSSAAHIDTPDQHRHAVAPRHNYIYKWVAAASVVMMVFAGYWILHKGHGTRPSAIAYNTGKADTLLPGGNHAVLTLANGKKILLDTAEDGLLNNQNNINVIKTKDGQIAYNGSAVAAVAGDNKITTPRGGQYQLLLADGTKVWLNSASSLQYPVIFTGNKRLVTLSGEAYFEVAKNKEKPFVVNVNGEQVKVLGTHFDIMAYDDEPAVKTTLIEGSVQVKKGMDSVLISPGEQAVSPNSGSDKLEVKQADIEETLAWTKGDFLFRSLSIDDIMRQIERWYNADVQYSSDVSDIRFSGGMQRKQDVSNLLEILEADGRLSFKIKGHIIIVSRKSK